jgi:hypothetical protein
MRTVEDGRYAIQPRRYPAACPLGDFAAESPNQRFNRSPPNASPRWTIEDSLKRCALSFIHLFA